MLQRARSIFLDYDTVPFEVWLGVLLLALAVVLGRPDVATFDSSPSFRIMASVAPEGAWATVMLLVGLVKLIGVFKGIIWLRWTGALLATVVWVAVALCIGKANPNGTGVVVYPMFALASVWILFRITSMARR